MSKGVNLASSEQHIPLVMVLDTTSNTGYLPFLVAGAEEAEWQVEEYDNEAYALEDLNGKVGKLAQALVLGLPKSNRQHYNGSAFVRRSDGLMIPRALVTIDTQAQNLAGRRKDIFVPGFERDKISERITNWLINLAGR